MHIVEKQSLDPLAPPPPPLEMGKKMLSEEILTSFTYVLLMKFRGIDIHATWKVVGGQALVHGGSGCGPCPLPLENEKKAVRGNFNLFRLCFTNEIRGGGDRYTIHAKWKGVGGQALVHGGEGGQMKKGKPNISQLASAVEGK